MKISSLKYYFKLIITLISSIHPIYIQYAHVDFILSLGHHLPFLHLYLKLYKSLQRPMHLRLQVNFIPIPLQRFTDSVLFPIRFQHHLHPKPPKIRKIHGLARRKVFKRLNLCLRNVLQVPLQLSKLRHVLQY